VATCRSWRQEPESAMWWRGTEPAIAPCRRHWFARSDVSTGLRIVLPPGRNLMSLQDERTKSASPPAVMVVMGVSGSGKSTIGALMARRLRWEFEDADWLHPAANVDKMHNGIPLTDQDRRPWLEAVAAWIDNTRRSGEHAVVACSALKRRYRDILIGDRADVRLVYLK